MIKNLIRLLLVLVCINVSSARANQIPSEQQLIDQKQKLSKAKQPELEATFEVHNPTKQYSRLKCFALVLGTNKMLDQMAKIIQYDLEFSDQVEIVLNKYSAELAPNVLTKLYDQGYSLCLYLKEEKNPANQLVINVLLKDPASGITFFEKKFAYQEKNIVLQAHKISDELCPAMTGEKGPSLSTLAYCKQLSKNQKVICLADYTCNYERTIIPGKTINIIPCFDINLPRIFYSQFTKTNCRLMQYNLATQKHHVVCSYDSLNMQPSFSPDGSKSVLCLSCRGNSELYLYDQSLCNKLGKRIFKQLTHNKGNNVSPCYLPSGDVAFCSDFESKFPQLYILDAKTQKTRRLTNGKGYCADPSYCSKTNKIVYTRYIKGTFQLCILDLNEKTLREKQLTTCQGDKIEPCWSDCGRYVSFTYAVGNTITKKIATQIAVFNTLSGKKRILTKGKEAKSFPAWTSKSLYTL